MPTRNLTDSKPVREPVNRAEQVSRDAKEFVQDPSTTLLGYDSAILWSLKNDIRPTVVDNGEEINVPVIWANAERWTSIQNQGYVKKEPYRSIFLTLKGQEVASISKKRHIIVLTFLKNLGLDARTAEADAEGIEHHVSNKTLKKMEQFNRKN